MESDTYFKHQQRRGKNVCNILASLVLTYMEQEYRLDEVRRWLTVILIGFFTALVAYGVHYSVEKFFEVKFTLMEQCEFLKIVIC